MEVTKNGHTNHLGQHWERNYRKQESEKMLVLWEGLNMATKVMQAVGKDLKKV